jgi:hypothetical protein
MNFAISLLSIPPSQYLRKTIAFFVQELAVKRHSPRGGAEIAHCLIFNIHRSITLYILQKRMKIGRLY